MEISYSVGIPTRDRPRELKYCLECIGMQQPVPRRYIIVDDGALDPDEIRSWMGPDAEKLVYHRKESPGTRASMRKVLELCRDDWLLFLDDDIYLEPDFMQRMTEVIENYPDREKISGLSGMILRPEREIISKRRKIRLFFEKIFMMNGGVEGRFFPSSFCTDYSCGHHPDKPYIVEHVPGGLGLWKTEILKDYYTDEFYTGNAYGQDKKIAYEISRNHMLICQPAAGAIHDKSPHARLDPRELGRIKVRNQVYFYRNIFRKNLLSFLFFGWALFGQIFLDAAAAVFSRDMRTRLSGVRGMISGIRSVFKGGSK